MTILEKTYYTYKDLTIIPTRVSSIEHRSNCIPYDEFGMLPLFTAPMDTVVDENNYSLFYDEMIYPILPRTIDLNTRISYSTKARWATYSLKEFEDVFCNNTSQIVSEHDIYALIDIANGHMKKLLTAHEQLKTFMVRKLKSW